MQKLRSSPGSHHLLIEIAFRPSNLLAWWHWGLVHVLFLLGSRNRAAVVLNWIWSYVTYRPR
jgi:NADH dehydrogenase FAD-containing subunit